MAVLLANRRLGVRRRGPATRDGYGEVVPGVLGPMLGPWPGRAEEGPDVPPDQVGGRTWTLAVDAAAWPLAQRDLVVDADSGQQWLVTSADLLANNADASVDYIRVRDAHLAAADGTRP